MKRGPITDEAARKAALTKILLFTLDGKSQNQIAKELRVAQSTISNIMKSPEFKESLVEYSERLKKETLAVIKKQANDRIVKAFKVVDQHLAEGNLKAAEAVIKLLDKEHIAVETQQADTTINVIMPTTQERQVRKVTGDDDAV